jgi:hypothetical protein
MAAIVAAGVEAKLHTLIARVVAGNAAANACTNRRASSGSA